MIHIYISIRYSIDKVFYTKIEIQYKQFIWMKNLGLSHLTICRLLETSSENFVKNIKWKYKIKYKKIYKIKYKI